jgi:hypothetical protein
VLKDPTDESKRALVHVKSNLSAQAAGLSFSIVSNKDTGDDRPSIRWQGECLQTLKADDKVLIVQNTGNS